MKNNTIGRDELYELIWSKPATQIAKDYGITDIGLGKVRSKLLISKPRVGYWQQKWVVCAFQGNEDREKHLLSLEGKTT